MRLGPAGERALKPWLISFDQATPGAPASQAWAGLCAGIGRHATSFLIDLDDRIPLNTPLLAAVISADKTARAYGLAVVVRCGPAAERVLRSLGLDHGLSLVGSLDDAVSLASG